MNERSLFRYDLWISERRGADFICDLFMLMMLHSFDFGNHAMELCHNRVLCVCRCNVLLLTDQISGWKKDCSTVHGACLHGIDRIVSHRSPLRFTFKLIPTQTVKLSGKKRRKKKTINNRNSCCCWLSSEKTTAISNTSSKFAANVFVCVCLCVYLWAATFLPLWF